MPSQLGRDFASPTFPHRGFRLRACPALIRSFGIAIPRTVLDETLARLSATARDTRAERIVVVGDLVHARRGLTREVVERVAAWRDGFAGAIEYVAGDHHLRAEIPEARRIRRREPLDAPFAFVHDPAEVGDGNTYAWCGHLHPTVRLASSTDRLVMPCFVIGASGDSARVHAIRARAGIRADGRRARLRRRGARRRGDSGVGARAGVRVASLRYGAAAPSRAARARRALAAARVFTGRKMFRVAIGEFNGLRQSRRGPCR